MDISILTFDGFNEIDSFIALNILGRVDHSNWNVQITSPSETITSMNGLKVTAQQPLEFANHADAVLIGSGVQTKDIAKNEDILSKLSLNPSKQLVGAQCSGAFLMAIMGLVNSVPVCTDLKTKILLEECGVKVLEQPFFAGGNIASTGGCMSSLYLAAWVISKLSSAAHAKDAVACVAPVGERDYTVNHCMSVIGMYI
ncbi:DJ-1/PfpI family protein [Teredinibacter turnerae]|uniref:DJ-1/PfpI family protein n=1 Tax=Teredinibacter turnerae TaxID=2426 RepID=UPI0005F83B26|nr:DJ-1/PfpI family protein [Teredinibacter turnerae]